jgi:phage replication-related protein YjqB (UPF0714/DUF867 family)
VWYRDRLAQPQNFKEILDRGIVPGRDIRIAFGDANIGRCLLVAPHGGGIEPGTSEILRAVAELGNWAWYEFAGFLRKGNKESLHITSTRFDEPTLVGLLPKANFVLTIHGSQLSGDSVVEVGGSWVEGRAAMMASINSALAAHNIQATAAPDHMCGTDPNNIANKGKLGRGLQLEFSRSARNLLFPPDCSREARGKRSPRLVALTKAIHTCLKQLANE